MIHSQARLITVVNTITREISANNYFKVSLFLTQSYRMTSEDLLQFTSNEPLFDAFA